MDRFDAKYYKLKNDTKRLYHSGILMIDRKQKKVLKRNVELKNKYSGRCFIVANGPSLATIDTSLLRSEFVFTVNYAMKSAIYRNLESNIHVMMDPNIFNFQGSEDPRVRQMEGINSKLSRPLCFFPYQAGDKIINYKIDEYLQVMYISSKYSIYDHYKREFDLTKICPGFANVTQYAIMIALYLGFNEIILIGCDMTGYEQLSINAGKESELHIYKMDDTERRMIAETHSTIPTEDYFLGFSNTFADFRRLKEYCEDCGVRLINATAGGVLDEIERVKYSSLF